MTVLARDLINVSEESDAKEAREMSELAKSRKLLATIWDNPSDAEYNNL